MDTKGKIATGMSIMAGAQTGLNIYYSVREKWSERSTFTLTVDEDSFIYEELLIWLNSQRKGKKYRLWSDYSGVHGILYDANGKAKFDVGGHSVYAWLDKPGMTEAGMALKELDMTPMGGKEVLKFSSANRSGIEAVYNLTLELAADKRKKTGKTFIYSLASYDCWSAREYAGRPMDSVFLPRGVKEEMITHFDTFLASEDKFKAVGFPWHYGILMHGDPGNGKSSMAAAISHYYKKHLYNLPLSTVTSDKHLNSAISSIQPGSILLLEDIDIFSNSMKREEKKDSPTLAGLLNALDGVATPHGLITVITTNKLESLDPALIRPGRIEHSVEFKAPDAYQIESMFESLYGEKLGVEPKSFKSMADVSNLFKAYLSDPEAARLELKV